MAIHICTALLVALMSFVHHLMHLVPALMMVIMVVMIAVVMSLTMLVMIAMVVMSLTMLVMIAMAMLLMLVMIAMVVVSLAMLVVALTMLVMIAVVMTAMLMIAMVMIAMLLGEHIKHLWALVVALAVARDASLVAGMNFHDFWALSFSLLECTFWFFGKLLVHPFQLKLRTIITFCFLARFMASFDSREILASLHERDPWFWALGVAI